MFSSISPRCAITLASPVFFVVVTTTSTWTPGELFPGMTEDGTYITIPISVFSNYNLTATNADATTGDARQFIMSIISRAFEWYNNLTTKPQALTMKLYRRTIPTAGNFIGKELTEITVSAYSNYPSGAVSDEP